jgi:endonuclease-8
MPEGPSIVILREMTQPFVGKTVRAVEGNSTVDLQRMIGRRIVACRSHGKHFLIEFSDFAMRVHLLMFGTYRINARKDATARMHLAFDSGEINFYTCSLKYIEGDLDDTYSWQNDVMSDEWSPRLARRRLMEHPERLICDMLLDQNIFAGVGNIICNEVLFRVGVHPENTISAFPPRKLGELIRQARVYSFDFLRWKKDFVLREHWQVHTRGICPQCGSKLRKTYPGKTKRRSFACPGCQVLYPANAAAPSPAAA